MRKTVVQTLSYQPRARLVTERYRHGWSQQEVADLIGTTRLNISRWERNLTNPGPFFRRQLCELFNMDETELGLLPEALMAEEMTTYRQEAEPKVLFDHSLPLP